jgi:hypothetical protein
VARLAVPDVAGEPATVVAARLHAPAAAGRLLAAGAP